MEGMRITISKVALANFLMFIFVFLITIFIGNAVYSLLRRMLDEKITQRHSKLVAHIIQYIILIGGAYFGLYHILHLDLKAFVASLGVMSVAIAFSSQQVIQNIIGGILISVKQPIRYDDWVEIGSSGISRVKDIVLTQTVLRTVNGRLIYIPNSVLLGTNIINYTKSGFLEIPVPLTVPYNTDLKIIHRIITEIAKAHAFILPNMPDSMKKDGEKTFGPVSAVKRILSRDFDIATFSPRVFVNDISGAKMTLSIRIWIYAIEKKDEIVSQFLQSLLRELQKEQITTL